MSFIVTEKKDHVALLKINRPEALNSLNEAVLNDLSAAVDEANADKDVYVLIITGEGRAFVAGADIAAMKPMNQKEGTDWAMFAQGIFRKIENMEKPVIAAINGFALGGGCELAMACDIRIASEKAKFGQPEVSLGITPGFSGTQRLPRLIGKGYAAEMILTGDMITADEAYRIRLVNKVVAPEALIDEAYALAARINKNGPLGVRNANRAIKKGLEQPDMDKANLIEAEAFGACFATADQKEGMGAFLEKRKAEFKGE